MRRAEAKRGADSWCIFSFASRLNAQSFKEQPPVAGQRPAIYRQCTLSAAAVAVM